jgi:tryptophanyl-tRNA synthetase
MDEVLTIPRQRYQSLMADPTKIESILAEGATRARAIAVQVMKRVRKAIGQSF